MKNNNMMSCSCQSFCDEKNIFYFLDTNMMSCYSCHWIGKGQHMTNKFNPLAQRISDPASQRDRLFSIQLAQGDSYLGGVMKAPDFEDFLVGKHGEQYVGTDDNMVDAFDDWIADLDSEDFIKYANQYAIKYGRYLVEDYKKEVLK